MAYCYECNSHISDDFARVFADEDGIVWACPECAPQSGIAESAKNNRARHRQAYGGSSDVDSKHRVEDSRASPPRS